MRMTTPSPEVVGLMVQLGDALGHATRPAVLPAELQRVVAGVRSLFSAAACSCALVRPDGESLRFAAADGVGAEAIVGVSLPIGRGIAGWAVMSGQPIVVGDVRKDARFARDIAEATDFVPETILAAPLVDDAGAVLGVLEVLDPQRRGEHSGHDLDVLGLVAAQVASIVRLSQVYDGLGTALVQALVGAEDPAAFRSALATVTGGEESDELAALARSFSELASAGPDGVRLAGRILEEVTAYARFRR